MVKNEIEKRLIIWNTEDGESIELADDGDGLGLHELRYVTPEGKIQDRILFTDEQLHLLHMAIHERMKPVVVKPTEEKPEPREVATSRL